MSAFHALTLKSSKKSAFLWKGVLDPRTHVWTDLKISKDMRGLSQDMALAYDSPVFSGKFVRQVAQKKFAFFPHSSICSKNKGGKRSHFHVNNHLLVLPFLLSSCSTKIDSEDLLWLHAEFTYVRHTAYIEECCFSSWPEISCLYVQSTLRTDLWRWILGWIPHCQSVRGG